MGFLDRFFRKAHPADTYGVRECQWYVRGKDAVMNLANESLGPKDPYPVEFVFQEDPDWQAYSRFLGNG